MDVGADIIGMVKTNTKDSERRPLRILQIIGREFLNSCRGARLWCPGAGF